MSLFVGEMLHAGQVLLIPSSSSATRFFVAAEFSLVTVRRTRLEELQAKRTPGITLAMLALDRLDHMLAATQLGITMTSLALAGSASPGSPISWSRGFRFLPPSWGLRVAQRRDARCVSRASRSSTRCGSWLRERSDPDPGQGGRALAGPLLAFERRG